jgi:hypothetical protein
MGWTVQQGKNATFKTFSEMKQAQHADCYVLKVNAATSCQGQIMRSTSWLQLAEARYFLLTNTTTWLDRFTAWNKEDVSDDAKKFIVIADFDHHFIGRTGHLAEARRALNVHPNINALGLEDLNYLKHKHLMVPVVRKHDVRHRMKSFAVRLTDTVQIRIRSMPAGFYTTSMASLASHSPLSDPIVSSSKCPSAAAEAVAAQARNPVLTHLSHRNNWIYNNAYSVWTLNFEKLNICLA